MGSNVVNFQKHPFHLVDPSPWPLLSSLAALTTTSGGVMWFHNYSGGGFVLFVGFLFLLSNMYVWWRDIVREGTFEGQHTAMVQLGLRMGMILFIVSEIMFFFAFFWAFFHGALAPAPEIGSVWPPKGIETLSAWEIPLLNTVILVTSGATCTWAHHAIVGGYRKQAVFSLILTLLLAILFTGFQGFEYAEAGFTISDSLYGSCFFSSDRISRVSCFYRYLFFSCLFN